MAFGVLGLLFRITRTATIDTMEAPFLELSNFMALKIEK